jgi:hypothetical protein
MKFEDFISSLHEPERPQGLDAYLRALWFDAHGNWHRAHQIVQEIDDVTAARIHAYLHRQEGDEWNAKYWHRQAGSVFPDDLSLQQEWHMLVRELTD